MDADAANLRVFTEAARVTCTAGVGERVRRQGERVRRQGGIDCGESECVDANANIKRRIRAGVAGGSCR